MSTAPGPVGFVGLGNMGQQLAANLAGAGIEVVGHDTAGPQRVPDGVAFEPDVAGVARRARIVVFSLPDGRVSELVARQISAADPCTVTHVVDTTTAGPHAARDVAALLGQHGIAYVDAPVSGGVAGARARTLTVMYSATDEACAVVEPVLAGLSDRRRRVGDRAGMAQAMKLANNFLSATALAATSEAIAFGLANGLDMATMLEVLNTSSGASSATADKFPSQVLTERYASGFSNSLMAKDLGLYVRAVAELGGPDTVGTVVRSIWERFDAAEPGADFTRIYPFTTGDQRATGSAGS